MGGYPGFDGSSFTPSPNAKPMTAMVTNSDRSIIYVATGGVQAASPIITASAQANPPELWQYEIDENKWTFLATTTSGNDQQYAPIQELWYNTYDEKLYGVQWKDYGDDQDAVEDYANKTNWICPSARIFNWNPAGDNGAINDGTHSVDAGNMWPARWDFRMMYPFDNNVKVGPKRTDNTRDSGSFAKQGELETHKTSLSRAGVGNYTSYRYMSLPFGPAGQQGFSNTHEVRRATHWMHPQTAGYHYTNHPSTDLFGETTQLVPTTAANGNSQWTGASGSTQPSGWSKHGSPTFSVSSGVMTMATASSSDGISFNLSPIHNNMTVYKLSLKGTNYKVKISNSSSGVPANSQVYGPYGMANIYSYNAAEFGNGDFYFSALSTNAIPGFPNFGVGKVFLTANNHASDVVMTDISLTIAHHWDHWHNLSRMAAENIPITHYSKVIGASSIRRPSHQFKGEPMGPQTGGGPGSGTQRFFNSHAGPHSWFYDMFGDDGNARDFISRGDATGRTSELNATSGDINVRQPSPHEVDHPQSGGLGTPDPAWTGQRNEELIMEFNAVAQDRRNLTQIGSSGVHPMFGPNDLEDGIQPDNMNRYVIGNRNVKKSGELSGANLASSNMGGFHADYYSSEAKINDIGPRIDVVNSEPLGIGTPNNQNFGINTIHGSDNTMQRGNQGAGYASVIVQGLGERAFREDDNHSIYGAVRYTNGQRGGIVFCQEADSGKGVIVFQRFNGTAPEDHRPFHWDPDATSGAGHFALTWRYYKCDGASQGGMGSMPPVTSTVSAVTPHTYTTVPNYVTAGCNGEGGRIFFATHESRTHSVLYNGSNQDDIINRSYIYAVDLGTGAFNSTVSSTTIYDSTSANSYYDTEMNGQARSSGSTFANYNSESGVNKTRKFLELHYNSSMSTAATGANGLFAACFKRDSILAEYNESTPYSPCHELVKWQGVNNRLQIVDHDIQDGANYDAVGFTGFVNTTGTIGPNDILAGTNPAVFYFRLQKATVGTNARDYFGVGLKLNYLYDTQAGNTSAGHFIDGKSAPLTRKIYANEGFISSSQVVLGLVDKGRDTERGALFAAFDDYRTWYSTSQQAKKKLAFGSTQNFFKIDDREVDPRVPLADFTNLTSFDAISKLAQAHNMAFGFDVEKFFLLNRESHTQTHVLDAQAGELIDIKKSLDNDIRNVISIQAFRQQVQDVEWEVTHVGGEEVLSDEQIYNGEFTVTPKTHREASVNLICTRSGRLIMDDFELDTDGDGEPDSTGNAVDAITNVGSRLTPLFKWKTHAPTKQIVCMKPLLANTTKVHTNTTFASGNSPITKGEIVIFTDQETFEQFGRVISEVDTVNNILVLEKSPGFTVEAGTPLNVVRAHTGNETDVDNSGNVVTANKNYGVKYSDEGVCVVTAVDNTNTVHGICSAGNYSHYSSKNTCESAGHTWTPVTRISVNNIRPFADCRITPYNVESYKHYSFLVTTLSTSQLAAVSLPNQVDEQFANQTTGAAQSVYITQPVGWVKAVDVNNNYLYMNGTYPSFEAGDILNAHYALQPASMIMQTDDGAIQPPPYSSVQQDLPEGLGTWSWKCDSLSDKFNEKDIINFKFQGIRLVKDSGSIYTIADTASIKRYGKRDWNFPDNRFIPHERVEYWATKYLKEFGDPKYAIEADVPFDPTLTFTTPAGNMLRKVKIIDEVMFPSMAGFSVTGYLRETTLNVKKLTTKIKMRTEEKY